MSEHKADCAGFPFATEQFSATYNGFECVDD